MNIRGFSHSGLIRILIVQKEVNWWIEIEHFLIDCGWKLICLLS